MSCLGGSAAHRQRLPARGHAGAAVDRAGQRDLLPADPRAGSGHHHQQRLPAGADERGVRRGARRATGPGAASCGLISACAPALETCEFLVHNEAPPKNPSHRLGPSFIAAFSARHWLPMACGGYAYGAPRVSTSCKSEWMPALRYLSLPCLRWCCENAQCEGLGLFRIWKEIPDIRVLRARLCH